MFRKDKMLIDLLYKMGVYKNELADYALENRELFLRDVDALENPPKIQLTKKISNFEKSIEALTKALYS